MHQFGVFAGGAAGDPAGFSGSVFYFVPTVLFFILVREALAGIGAGNLGGAGRWVFADAQEANGVR